ncbi:MAG: tRNA guanosine(15) transglycosylase TgtA [Candidatus Lokiarchaeota archaeon]|nr:tRNA guanosine(15) transglycosylase TgtA [Candidatus Lokiarchaeota archaeon]
MIYEILDIDALGRIGKIIKDGKELITPNLIPVIHPSNNLITPNEIKKIGFDCIFTNAYIIYQNEKLRHEVVKKDLHRYFDYDGLIATDSGAFQQYMYNDNKIQIDPRDIEQFQEDIGSDFPVILDIPVQPEDSYEIAKEKVEISIKRAKDNIGWRKKKIGWIGPIHGAEFSDLLSKSTLEMSKLNFDIYAIGGLVKYFLEYEFEIVLNILTTVKQSLIPNKPLHMFGLGLPQFFSLAVAFGCDLMDSAAYILYAKEDRYFTLSGTRKLEDLYEFPCHCPICIEYSPEDIRRFEEKKKIRLLAMHNLYISHLELKSIRQAIREGRLWELVEQRMSVHPYLVKAYRILKKHLPLFEKNEKIYKDHGRLFSSSESSNRPIIYRYNLRLDQNYRVPKHVKFLILLPELDIKGEKSPSIRKWIENINYNKIINPMLIHIAFYSNNFGIIPLELSDVFPMGQHESIEYDIINHTAYTIIENYFKKNSGNYSNCTFLIPESYINQNNKKIPFNSTLLLEIVNKIKDRFKIPIKIFNNLEDLLNHLNSIKL